MSRRARILVIGVVVAALVVVGVIYLPTRAWYSQQKETGQSEQQLRKLEESNENLARKINRLSDASTIEEQARQQFGFVFAGEELYPVPPAGPTAVNLPPVWPFDLLQDPIARAAARQE